MSNPSHAVRYRRLTVLGVLIAVGIAIWFGVAGGNGKRRAAQVVVRDPDPIAAIESGLLPWRLPVAVSREVVLPGRRNQVVVLGGLSGSTSQTGVFSLNTRNGGLRSIGSLPVGVHDAAASVVGGRDVVFGGGTPTTVGSVEGFPAGRSARLGSGGAACASKGANHNDKGFI
jgi:hypothetical protein